MAGIINWFPVLSFKSGKEVEESLKQHILQILRYNYSLSPCFEDLSLTGQTILALNAAGKKIIILVMKNTEINLC